MPEVKRVRHADLHPAFDLKAGSYFLDFALVPLAVLGLLVFALAGARVSSVAIAIVLGIAAWSLAEYWIHRLLFHGSTPFEPMHQQHHALPKDMIGVASWGTFPGFALVWLIGWMIAGSADLGAAFASGLMLGYLFYCTIHVSMHHAKAFGFGRYGRMMRSLHQAHHRGGSGNFGVSSPIWDIVFLTYRQAPRTDDGSDDRRTLEERILSGFFPFLWRSVALIVLIAALVSIARARDLDGRFAQSPNKEWFDQLRSGKGPCCSDADGSAISDADWEVKAGRYRVRVPIRPGGDVVQWIDVPDDAVITEPNRAGKTMVWPMYGYMGVSIRCFMPGEMG